MLRLSRISSIVSLSSQFSQLSVASESDEAYIVDVSANGSELGAELRLAELSCLSRDRWSLSLSCGESVCGSRRDENGRRSSDDTSSRRLSKADIHQDGILLACKW